MSNTVKHKFVSIYSDGADATKLRPSDWHAEHAFAGGVAGQYLVRDTSATDGASWRTPATPFINVSDYGAVGDGVANDTVAIQAAITAAVASGGGCIYLPHGSYMLRSPLDLTGISLSNSLNNISMVGAGMYASALLAGFTGGPVLDLSNSSFLSFANFRVSPVGSFTPAEVVLMARPANNNSAGDHTFTNVWLDGKTTNATVVMWGSEQNKFYACLIWSSTNKPALVSAVKMSEAGFTPTSSFQTLGTGEGGATVNSFDGTRFGNETGVAQSVPLLKLYGAMGWSFRDCFFAADTVNLIEINASSYPSDAASVYFSGLTFDDCVHENAWGAADTDRSLYFSAPWIVNQVSAKWLAVRNCSFFNIYAEDGVELDGMVYEGGKYSNSVAVPAGTKLSVYKLSNSRIAPSKSERGLNYTVRHTSDSVVFDGITAGKVAAGAGTYAFIDSTRNVQSTGGYLSQSPSTGIGYAGGAGGAGTQVGASGNTVTLNTIAGRVTTVALTTAAGAKEQFAVANSQITSSDVVVVTSVYTGAGLPFLWARGATGSFLVNIENRHATDALNAAVTFNYVILRGISA